MLYLLTLASIVALLFFVFLLVRQFALRSERRQPWARFQSKYAGMTTNERLVAAGLLGDFRTAAHERDIPSMVAILEQVELPPHESDAIAERIFADPERYGY